jgi:drug/metabolite transporter (DMT)-like permease
VGALTLGEPIGINLVVGLLAVFAGIWIATRESADKKRANLRT